MLTQLAEALSSSPHLEFLLTWVRAICTAHGEQLRQAQQGGGGGGGSGSAVAPALRALQKGLGRLHADLASTCEGNLYTLDYLVAVAGHAEEEEQAGGAAE